ncbi:hypothetical protein BC829DRAFT_403000 [Chytridium lagenaria]|nr:hypothetical protein BC829DRAFT_403000 [Chytridium lagenaria]
MDHDNKMLPRRYAASQLKLVSSDVVKPIFFEVEQILAFKRVRGKPFYFVRWEKLGPAEDF